ncbi:MAG: CPBP family intramembrane metalloprotease [Streptosporangiales bacterium]|nr:CPBP family intramembrane metalloprotease [Streptosporangiales bacterium]
MSGRDGPRLDYRRVGIYLTIAFGLAWGTVLVLYLTGGLVHSPVLIPGTPVTLALILVPTLFMWSPALAHIITRLVTGEGWHDLWLRPDLGRVRRPLLASWAGTVLCVLAGGLVFFAVFPGAFDPSMSALRERAGGQLPTSPSASAAILLLLALLVLFIAPLFNSLFTFGEEFGWRAYLQPHLLALGSRRAVVITGLIWGAWHWPLTAMGHNYGTRYASAPWLGMLAMTWFTLVVGIFLGYLTLRAGSVWPAVLGHGTLNAVAGLPILVSAGGISPVLGPHPAGLFGSAGFTAAALWILLTPRSMLRGTQSRQTGPTT